MYCAVTLELFGVPKSENTTVPLTTELQSYCWYCDRAPAATASSDERNIISDIPILTNV